MKHIVHTRMAFMHCIDNAKKGDTIEFHEGEKQGCWICYKRKLKASRVSQEQVKK